uniref:Protein TILLER ANGLE CONTROL 1 n=1 Tax=Davidia involucrata TaxID=16924 RepID=A0A5B7AVQ8_DAVIN
MKIFDWVHRRFHHKDGLGGNVKNAEFVANDGDTQVLLEHVTPVDVLDGWKDGILTIGTLGFDPLKDFNEKIECPMAYKEEEYCDGEEYLVDDDEYDHDDNDMDDEELNPLVFTAFRHGFDKDSGLNSCDDHHQNARKADLIMTIDDGSTPIVLGEDSNRKKRGERTTLADLFSADSESEDNTKPDHGKVQPEHSKKPPIQAKNGRSFAKKLIPRVGEDSRPARFIRLKVRLNLVYWDFMMTNMEPITNQFLFFKLKMLSSELQMESEVLRDAFLPRTMS